MSINFKVNKTADSGNISANDRSGIVNGSYSFLKNFDVKLNSKKVYDCKEANHAVKIKICSNIVQFMLKAQQPMNFSISILIRMQKNGLHAKTNWITIKGFNNSLHKALFGTSSTVNTEIPQGHPSSIFGKYLFGRRFEI